MAHVTRYCPSCGLERREGERFCRNCGAPLGTGQTRLHESPVGAPPPVEQATTEPLASAVPLPAPPTAPHPVVRASPAIPGQSAGRTLPFKPLALAGGALLVIGALVPWITASGSSSNALDFPVQSLWDLGATEGPIKVGFVTIGLGLIGGGLAFLPRTATIRRLCGSIALAVVLAFALQFYRAIEQSGGSVEDFVRSLAIGVYLSLAGAIGLQVSR